MSARQYAALQLPHFRKIEPIKHLSFVLPSVLFSQWVPVPPGMLLTSLSNYSNEIREYALHRSTAFAGELTEAPVTVPISMAKPL